MTWADDAVAAIEPWYTVDWETYVRAIMGMLQNVEDYVSDQPDGAPGWSRMLDVDNATPNGLPYLAQWVGERLPVGIDDADARAWIRAAPHYWRGTPYSVASAAQRHLTGPRLVQIRERHKLDGTFDEDWIAVQTYTAQTPNPTLTHDEVRAMVPADIQLDFLVSDGATWGNVNSGYVSWAALYAAKPTWNDVMGAVSGYVSWLTP